MTSVQEEFIKIYRDCAWGDGSGPGSDPTAAAPFRTFIELFLRRHDVANVLDIGCGDWRIGATIDWGNTTYTGIDIVPTLVKQNRRLHVAARRHFYVADALSDPLPPADLVILKEVFQHWTNEEIARFIPKMRQYPHAIVVNDVAIDGDPTGTGALNSNVFLNHCCRYRPVDITRPPFSLNAQLALAYTVGIHVKCIHVVHA